MADEPTNNPRVAFPDWAGAQRTLSWIRNNYVAGRVALFANLLLQLATADPSGDPFAALTGLSRVPDASVDAFLTEIDAIGYCYQWVGSWTAGGALFVWPQWASVPDAVARVVDTDAFHAVDPELVHRQKLLRAEDGSRTASGASVVCEDQSGMAGCDASAGEDVYVDGPAVHQIDWASSA
jgi:hypothetical protein